MLVRIAGKYRAWLMLGCAASVPVRPSRPRLPSLAKSRANDGTQASFQPLHRLHRLVVLVTVLQPQKLLKRVNYEQPRVGMSLDCWE